MTLPTPTAMPVNGFFYTPAISIVLVPPYTPWQVGVVERAVKVWNAAQVWWSKKQAAAGAVYSFVVTSAGPVVVHLSIPPAYENFASWTQYKYQGLSTIIHADVYFDGSTTFTPTSANYAYRLALHELGHVLGLGLTLGTSDIMDGWQINSANLPPAISNLDLFAIQLKAPKFHFVHLPPNMPYEQYPATQFE